MLYWLAPATGIILILIGLSLTRIRIPRDLTREKQNDFESTVEYERVNHWPVFKIIRHYFLRQLKKYQPRGTLMDAGCGPGCLALDIASKFPGVSVTGVDISREILDLALINRQRAPPGLKVQFQQASVEDLPFTENSIDFTVSTLSLHHWTHPGKAFAEIYRVTRPGGQVLIFDLRRDFPRALFYLVHFVQHFFAAPPIRRVNGGVGSVWSSFTPSEINMILNTSPFEEWKIIKSWGWIYIWAKKSAGTGTPGFIQESP